MSRPSSPSASTGSSDPQPSLLRSIIETVSTKRARSIPEKQVVILGEPHTGKTTLISSIIQGPSASQGSDFLIGYEWCNVTDDGDDDTILTRLSIYTAPSSHEYLTALIPIFVPPLKSLHHTAVVIVLDWTRPWTFIDHLRTWFSWIESWSKLNDNPKLEVAREENREKLQYFWQRYTEPTSSGLPTSSAALDESLLPLENGVLSHNSAGVPIIVVCTKADLINDPANIPAGSVGLAKSGESEETNDNIMQILRTICLQYGAALFYTTKSPETLSFFRKYLLHLLFMPPAPSLGGDTAANVRNPFPYNQKANVLDLDRIFVPAGWDSAGKIGVVRDGFDAKLWRDAWDADLKRAEGNEESDTVGASKLYAKLVPDRSPKPPELPPLFVPMDEQEFLLKHYEELQKKPDKDPRGAFRNVDEVTVPAVGMVGPLGSSGVSMPIIEKAFADTDGRGSPQSAETRRGLRRDPPARPPNFLASNTTSSPSRDATNGGPISPTSDRDENTVLKQFFTGLINRSKSGTNATPSPSPLKAESSQSSKNDAESDSAPTESAEPEAAEETDAEEPPETDDAGDDA